MNIYKSSKIFIFLVTGILLACSSNIISKEKDPSTKTTSALNTSVIEILISNMTSNKIKDDV